MPGRMADTLRIRSLGTSPHATSYCFLTNGASSPQPGHPRYCLGPHHVFPSGCKISANLSSFTGGENPTGPSRPTCGRSGRRNVHTRARACGHSRAGTRTGEGRPTWRLRETEKARGKHMHDRITLCVSTAGAQTVSTCD